MKLTRTRKVVAVALSAAALAATFAAPATAQEPALVAPGGAFRVFPQEPQTEMPLEGAANGHITIPPEASVASCSQGPSGTIRGERVLLIAGHCVLQDNETPTFSTEATVPVAGKYPRIGERKAAHKPTEYEHTFWPHEFFWDTVNTDDWGVVLIDDSVPATSISQSSNAAGAPVSAPVQLRSIRDYPTLPVNQFSTDNFGQPICKDGATSGRSCGTQIGRSRNGVYSWGLNYQGGDSGGINYDPNDGAVIGVTSMGIGPLGKAQPADRIIEDAYGVPDGHVNEEFTLEQSTAPHADYTSLNQEFDQVMNTIQEENPEVEISTPKEAWDKSVAVAQQDANTLAQRAGQVNSVESAQEVANMAGAAADHHSQQLAVTGANYLINDVLGQGRPH
ncbi:S1 family peptidase [Corynebacterium hadale]|uniref:S1 family peptidase n=1 Tax=Corynebacterium hadale TaxID=2026255 RepID=UPI001EF3942F|nr:S1 family peptidase [Corynebacterium hadale]MCG7254098.1 S1 family peptidase [Corynebacterium hadale]MCG7256479.1 S1 family peptidase [Corynebacterium hadale]MCG7264879.1 S1 family peptidase [Corynebacterium hadale]